MVYDMRGYFQRGARFDFIAAKRVRVGVVQEGLRGKGSGTWVFI